MRTLPLRTALVTTTVACLVLLYVVWWTTYAGIHFNERYVQLAPGAAGQAKGTSIRVVSLTQTPQLANQKYDDPPKSADPGAVWMVAVMESSHEAGAPEFLCTVELLGPDGRRWEKTGEGSRALPSCVSDEVNAPGPVRFEEVFEVPQEFAAQIMGVALVDMSDADRTVVLTPPR